MSTSSRTTPSALRSSAPGNQHSSEPIWNTTGTRLIYKEQYLEITSWAARGLHHVRPWRAHLHKR